MYSDSILEVGKMLNLRYRIEKLIEEQEDTVTYLAYDTKKEIKVIVKEFSPMDWGSERRLFEAGKRDFMKMAGNIAVNSGKRGMVSVIDWFLENGTAYAVEDYIEGTPLMNYVVLKRNSGGLTMENIKFFMDDIFKAIKAVHRTGICHGNISPDNILIQENGEAKLIGFSFISPELKKQTYEYLNYEAGKFPVRNPGYAAPEQYYLEDEWGYCCDVYGISAVLYYCITGAVPPDALSRINGSKAVKRPSKINKALSGHDEKVILKGMETDRKYRYPDLDIMYNELYCVTNEQEEKEELRDLERKLHAEQEREIFGEEDWLQDETIENIERNLNYGIDREVRQVRREKRQEELERKLTKLNVSEPYIVNEKSKKNPVRKEAGKKRRVVLLIILAITLCAAAILSLIMIINSSFFDDKPIDDRTQEETESPSPTPGLTSEIYELRAKNVYKVYRDEVSDYALLVLSFTNNSDEAVCLKDIYEVVIQENGTDLKMVDKFSTDKFRSGNEKNTVEPGETIQVNLMYYLLDKEINKISVIFNSLTGSGVRVERRMKLSRKYYGMAVKIDSGSSGNKEETQSPTQEPESEDGKVVFSNVSASSSLASAVSSSGKQYTYTPDNLIDGDLTTCWSEGQWGDGVGEYVRFSSDKPQEVRGMNFYNGSEETEYWFNMNSRVTEISIEFSDGTKIYRTISPDIDKQPVTIDFGRTITTTSVKLTIVKAMVPENGYPDTSISEIEFY